MPKIVQSVGTCIKLVMPLGSNDPEFVRDAVPKSKHSDPKLEWLLAPEIPTDLFGVAAYLCKVSGLLGFYEPSPYSSNGQDMQFVFDRAQRDYIDDVVWEWRGGKRGGRPSHEGFESICEPSGSPPLEVQKNWKILLDHWDQPINCGFYRHTSTDPNPPAWWRAVLSLVMISDLVCPRIFRDPIKQFDGQPLCEIIQTLYQIEDAQTDPEDIPDDIGDGASETKINYATIEAPRGPPSLTMWVDTSVACVMPKIRVAGVGATIRNVSRNLALLPGRGEMRCFWDMTDAEPKSEDQDTLDVLIIPAPFSLDAIDFSPNQTENEAPDVDQLKYDKPAWDNFHVRQSWIVGKEKREEFIRSCVDMIVECQKESRNVNAVVLPEYSVDYDLFDRLCGRLKEQESGLEFIVAGSSNNCRGEKANTLLTRVWQRRNPATHITNSRSKHHRWRLDRRQVASYGLGTSLNPLVKAWWETTPICQRELFFHRFREGSTFSALICEELARSDICHDVIRAVGPNLVFALLMDSAQIPSRWSAQYAGSLADDPGSAVLSLTSYGLVERANRLRKGGSSSIALWKDDTGDLKEIDMPSGSGPRGVLLSLWSAKVQDQTITGKRSLVSAWRYASHYPVYARKSGS